MRVGDLVLYIDVFLFFSFFSFKLEVGMIPCGSVLEIHLTPLSSLKPVHFEQNAI